MEQLRREHDIIDERVVGFKNEADIWNQIEDLNARSFIIIFDSNTPKNVFRYTIKTKSNHFKTNQQYSKNLPWIASKTKNEYIDDGFLGLQQALDMKFFETSANKPYRIELERFPAPNHEPEASRINEFGTYFIIFSAFICISLVFTRIVEEKACGFREQLKNATRHSFLNNVALFSVNHLQMLVLFLICLLITYVKGFWFSVNIIYPMLLLIVFVTSIMCFTFFVSAFFESSE